MKYSEFPLDMLTSDEKKALAAYLRKNTGAGSVPQLVHTSDLERGGWWRRILLGLFC